MGALSAGSLSGAASTRVCASCGSKDVGFKGMGSSKVDHCHRCRRTTTVYKVSMEAVIPMKPFLVKGSLALAQDTATTIEKMTDLEKRAERLENTERSRHEGCKLGA